MKVVHKKDSARPGKGTDKKQSAVLNENRMKVVHKTDPNLSHFEIAVQHERDGDYEQAAKFYRDALELNPRFENAWQRLMIVYRKQKKYEQELKTINKAIKTFEESSVANRWAENKSVSRLSRSFAKLTGLIDKKGKKVYPGQPIAKWLKRKELLMKRMNKEK